MGDFGVHLVCDVWDLLDEGIDEVLDRALGELGVTGVSVPVICPPASRLRCHSGVSPRWLRSGGGAFFHPKDGENSATSCRPVTDGGLKSSDPLARVADACRARHLECRAVIYVATAGQVAVRHPHTAAKSALGDAWAGRICLVNPDVQAMLAAVCADLTSNFDLCGVALAEVHVGRTEQVAEDLTLPFDLGVAGRALLSMCFCESCRQLRLDDAPDGLDAAAAARSAQVRLEKILETGKPLSGAVAGLFEEDAVLRSFAAAQWASVGRAVQAASHACRGRLTLLTYADAVPCRGEWPWAGIASAPAVGAVARLSQDGDDATRVQQVAQAGDGVRSEVWLRMDDWVGAADGVADSSTLVRRLTALAESGVARVTLDGYGSLPRSAMAGVKQAIRFARRSV
ncbi:MAG: hypothetical protein ACE5GE_06745 [Phycisphaerae bacterium]